VLILAVAVILAGPFSEAIWERLQSFLLPAEQAIPNRLPTWLLGISFFIDSPLIGNGLGSFFVLATRANSPLVFPHNFYLFILVEFGLVGMAIVLLWAYQFYSSFRRYKWGVVDEETYLMSRGLVAGAIVIVLHAFFRSFSLTDPTFWGYFGMTSAFLKVYQPALQGASCEDERQERYAQQAQPVW
jgi:O-antigen ligase